MNRRDVLRITALATGGAICTPLASSILSGCTVPPPDLPEGELFFFTPEEYVLMKSYVDTLLPKTDSPSASELDIHGTIDKMVGTVYFPQDRENYRTDFDTLLKVLNQKGKFKDLEEKDRIKTILKLEGETDSPAANAHRHIKQQTVAYYLSTEEIGKNYLNYLPVPGEYQGCISLEEAGGKAWAL